MLESKGLKVNISKTKVMRCARDGAPKEAAVNPCTIQCVWKEGGCELNPLCNMWLLGTRAMFRGSLARVAQGFVCNCVELEEAKQLMGFTSKM